MRQQKIIYCTWCLLSYHKPTCMSMYLARPSIRRHQCTCPYILDGVHSISRIANVKAEISASACVFIALDESGWVEKPIQTSKHACMTLHCIHLEWYCTFVVVSSHLDIHATSLLCDVAGASSSLMHTLMEKGGPSWERGERRRDETGNIMDRRRSMEPSY